MNHLTEKNAKYIQYSSYPKPELFKREPELKLEGHFECQPEYRKAYIDYLIRERVERKPRPLDNLGTLPKRAFDIVPSKDTNGTSVSNTENVKVAEELSTKIKTPAPETRASHIPVAIKKLPHDAALEIVDTQKKPPTSSHSSASSLRPKPTSKLAPPPKATHLHVKSGTSSKQSSRNVSPVPAASRRSRSDGPSPRASRQLTRFKNEKEETVHHSRVGSRFTSPVKVEDLAYRPSTSPLSVLLHSREHQSRRSRRDTKANDENSRAFLVIDKGFGSRNDDFPRDGKSKSNTQNSLFKEQRWMSPWYSPPF